jgi:GNAT superfamily N-acetyltransferase
VAELVTATCEECGRTVEGDGLEAFGDAFIAHARADHSDWPYPEVAIRNYGEARLRLTGGRERLDRIGEITVHPVTEDRIDDWLNFFDHDAFADNAGWAACYCAEPHVLARGVASGHEPVPWQQSRAYMVDMLRAGRSFGYLAYVDGRPAGWVNASKRSEYALYRLASPDDAEAIGISCFVIAPPYRHHGLAAKLLARVVSDAATRGAEWIEAYPFDGEPDGDGSNFHGPRSLFDAHGFTPVETRERYTVVRRRA